MTNLFYDKEIKGFFGEYRYLSNYDTTGFFVDGQFYKSSEHWYMSHKTDDPELKQRILDAEKPNIAKKLGLEAKLPPDWDIIKSKIMYEGLMYKFENPVLRKKLLSTGDAYLEETNTWGDQYWGVCNGKGQNILGKLLMHLRSKIRNEKEESEKI